MFACKALPNSGNTFLHVDGMCDETTRIFDRHNCCGSSTRRVRRRWRRVGLHGAQPLAADHLRVRLGRLAVRGGEAHPVAGLAQLAAASDTATRLHWAHGDLAGYSVFEEAFTRGHLAGQHIARQLRGFYVEGAYRVWNAGPARDLVLFARHENFDTQFRMPDAFLPLEEFDLGDYR